MPEGLLTPAPAPFRFRVLPLEILGRVTDTVLLSLRAAKGKVDLALLSECVPSPAFARPWTHTGGHRVSPGSAGAPLPPLLRARVACWLLAEHGLLAPQDM